MSAAANSTQSLDPDQVLHLSCPACSGGLHLKRKHIGVAGACVHCKTPVKAVASGEGVALQLSGAAAVRPAEPVIPDPEPAAEVAEPEEPAFGSRWGFPEREAEVPNTPISLEAPQDSPVGSPHEWENPVDLGEILEEERPTPAPEFVDKPKEVTADFDWSDGAIPELSEAPLEPLSNEPEKNQPFGKTSTSSTDSLFADYDAPPAVNPGWGAKVPSPNHASMSPFATGSAESGAGFAETLFREGNKKSEPAVSPLGPPIGAGMSVASAPAPIPYDSSSLGASERPMAAMSAGEQEQFAKDMMHINGYSRKPRWLKRLIRFVITVGVLGGLGAGAYFFLPQAMVATAKAKVKEWLEPGAVLLEYLPFDVETTEGKDGKKERKMKIHALEGLDKFSGEYQEYQKASQDQLGVDVPEGEQPEVKMPELPKIPGLKIGGE